MRLVNYPGIVAVPGHPDNAYSGRRGYLLEGIVVHTMAGTLAGADSWVANPRAGAGWHFSVGRGGEVHQHYDLSVGPFAHGAIEPGATAKLVHDNGPAINPNWYLAAIEHDDEGKGRLPTVAQLEASAQLAAVLFRDAILPNAARTGAAVDREHILRHQEISPRSRPNCPGWPEEMLQLYVARVQVLTGTVPEPQPVADEHIGFPRTWPLIQAAAAKYGADPHVMAGIVAQESAFVNYRVHGDGTGHGLIGLDDNGLLPDFERWADLNVGRGASAAVIPPEKQIEYLSRMIAAFTEAHQRDPFAAARRWHRGGQFMDDARGRNYESLIRGHIKRLFPDLTPPKPPPPDPYALLRVDLGLLAEGVGHVEQRARLIKTGGLRYLVDGIDEMEYRGQQLAERIREVAAKLGQEGYGA